MTVRAYVPITLRLLREARDRGGFGPSPVRAHAVTPGLAALDPGAGEEELEWAASVAASLDSLRLLASEPVDESAGGAPLRRVVAAVDVGSRADPQEGQVEDQAGEQSADPDGEEAPSRVVLHEVPLRRLAALLVDAPDAGPLVRAARDALAGGAAEDDPAVERCLDEDLGWWAASELDVLLDLRLDATHDG